MRLNMTLALLILAMGLLTNCDTTSITPTDDPPTNIIDPPTNIVDPPTNIIDPPTNTVPTNSVTNPIVHSIPTISFASSSAIKIEEDITVSVALSLDTNTTRELLLILSTEGSTADYGADYSIVDYDPAITSFIIPSGVTSHSIDLAINEDDLDEEHENITLTLTEIETLDGTPAYRLNESRNSYTLTIWEGGSLRVPASSDTGESDSDGITMDNSPAIEGRAFDSSSIIATLTGGDLGGRRGRKIARPEVSFPHSFSLSICCYTDENLQTVPFEDGVYFLDLTQREGSLSLGRVQITIDTTNNFFFLTRPDPDIEANQQLLANAEYNTIFTDNPLNPHTNYSYFQNGAEVRVQVPHVVGPGHTFTYVFKFNELMADQTLSLWHRRRNDSARKLILLNRDESDKSIFRGSGMISATDESTNIGGGDLVVRTEDGGGFRDLAGNVSEATEISTWRLNSIITVQLYIDTIPSPSSFALYPDTNPVNIRTMPESNFITSDTTPTIGGQFEAGSEWVITVGSISLTNRLPKDGFVFFNSIPTRTLFESQTLPTMSPGSYPITVRVTDLGGNVSISSNTLVIE